MRPLIYKGLTFLKKASKTAYMRRIYPDLTIHTSHFKIGAKNRLILMIIFQGF